MKPAFAFALLLPVLPTAAAAQPAPQTPTIVRASIDKVDGDRLSVTDRQGRQEVLVLAPGARIQALSKIDISAIKPGSFIGTAATGGPDGPLKALEVHVFPEAMRGTGEGHRPWGSAPNATMTNGTVQAPQTMTNGTVGTVNGSGVRTITVAYKGGEQVVTISPDTPIVTFEPGDRSLLVPGASIMAFAAPAADGTLTVRQVSVGKNGLVPPM